MSNSSTLSATLAHNAGLPANCFTVGRFGEPVVGIELSLERGTDDLRPLLPHVLVGGFRIHLDAYKGCHYTMHESDRKRATVRCLALRECVAKASGRVFHTLMQPDTNKVPYSIVKVDNRLPYAKGPVTVNDRELRLWTGVVGGTMVASEGYEALVQLEEGEKIEVFFEDGAVRRFIRQGASLEETLIGSHEQLDRRIAEAWKQLDRATSYKDGARERTIFAILSGMTDILHLTTRFNQRGLGQEMRVKLIRELFLELAPEAFGLCHRKVTAILHQVDPPLLAMLRDGGSVEKIELPAGVTDIDEARRARERAKQEANREARRQKRIAAQPKKGPSGQKNKATTNPKKLTKIARKQAHGK